MLSESNSTGMSTEQISFLSLSESLSPGFLFIFLKMGNRHHREEILHLHTYSDFLLSNRRHFATVSDSIGQV